MEFGSGIASASALPWTERVAPSRFARPTMELKIDPLREKVDSPARRAALIDCVDSGCPGSTRLSISVHNRIWSKATRKIGSLLHFRPSCSQASCSQLAQRYAHADTLHAATGEKPNPSAEAQLAKLQARLTIASFVTTVAIIRIVPFIISAAGSLF